jgi:hypothetical protein
LMFEYGNKTEEKIEESLSSRGNEGKEKRR